ncbi:MAG TPA: FAD:protein FMN transferase [Thermoanaerobaculia bacterium]|nr:FAD:protein FMN transferase [Thermoanaerobaculia bacterium]
MRAKVLALLALLAASAAAAAAAAGAVAGERTLIVKTTAFGVPLRFEALAGAGVEAALREAIDAVRELEKAADPAAGPLAAINAAAGSGPHAAPAALLVALTRALTFCRWSEGLQGPLGGALYELWGLRAVRTALPTEAALQQATATAACDRLALDVEHGSLTLTAGARLDLWGFALGAALDRAAEQLAARGVADMSLTLGPVQRARGGGPAGEGWPLQVAVPAHVASFTRNLRLRDQAFALASGSDGALRAGGATYPPYLDLRHGQPSSGVIATVAMTDLATDAQGLATTLFAAGNRHGSLLLGELRPQPAALWVLGDGSGEPLITDYHWGTRIRRDGG